VNKQIVVGLDVFAHIWSQRLPHETTEDEILSRLLKVASVMPSGKSALSKTPLSRAGAMLSANTAPLSKKWREVLMWTLEQYGGRATLAEIYKTSREGRLALGLPVTAEHDASARECLESHCKESSKYRGKADLFYMPEGKGAGIWAIRK
jgi:hypothetical protein